MGHAGNVAAPPGKPLMIFDGDCRFCTLWIRRWNQMTGDKVDYIPFQDTTVPRKFPELARAQFEAAVHFIETDGNVYRGAEAVYRSLAYSCGKGWLLKLYRRSRYFREASEESYAFVAKHRVAFSGLTRFAFGKHVEQPNHVLVRWIFLRGLGLIYLCAFLSLWPQITGLVGGNGIVPAEQFMNGAKQYFDQQHIGSVERFHALPTLCWFSASDDFLRGLCATGAVLSALLIFAIAPAPCLALLWLIYLSLCSVCSPFLDFQWDILLLETGFLAIFFAPLRLWPKLSREQPPSRIILWLLRWLCFRLMFESGVVKLLSGDPTWKNLTALTFHYETQPLPTWIGWHAHQLPLWFQKISCVGMFAVELVVPFLIFAPRRIRAFACWTMVAFQIGIGLTGNYCFFNLLTILLCLTLLDDFALERFFPRRFRQGSVAAETRSGRLRLRRFVIVPLAAVVISVTGAQLLGMFRLAGWVPTPVVATAEWLSPFRTLNSYGLFAVMTTSRPEIIVEGSNDGVNWLAYEFKYKAGDLSRRPRFVEPHQPRLDWQMWFAALGDYRGNHWFVKSCARLLDGSPEVLAMLEKNPFPDAPPKFLRAQVFNYHFTTAAEREKTGNWWKREFVRDYLPVISRENFR